MNSEATARDKTNPISLRPRKANLDILYSPSRWSPRMCSCEVNKDHISFIQRGSLFVFDPISRNRLTAFSESVRARKSVPHQIDVSYGITDPEKVDIFGTDLPDYADICMYIHGGYWSLGSRSESSFVALALYPLGIKTIPVGYALCPQVTVKQITQQIFAAFKFVLAYAQKMKSRNIHLMGHSAGAHLIAILMCQLDEENEYTCPGRTHALIKNVILISGVYDLRLLRETYINKDLQLDPKDAVELSPMLRLAKSCRCLPDKQIDCEVGSEDAVEVTTQGSRATLESSTGCCKKLKVAHSHVWSGFPRMMLYVFVGEHDSPAFHDDAEKFFEFFTDFTAQKRATYVEVEAKDHFGIVHSMLENDNPIINLFRTV